MYINIHIYVYIYITLIPLARHPTQASCCLIDKLSVSVVPRSFSAVCLNGWSTTAATVHPLRQYTLLVCRLYERSSVNIKLTLLVNRCSIKIHKSALCNCGFSNIELLCSMPVCHAVICLGLSMTRTNLSQPNLFPYFQRKRSYVLLMV